MPCVLGPARSRLRLALMRVLAPAGYKVLELGRVLVPFGLSSEYPALGVLRRWTFSFSCYRGFNLAWSLIIFLVVANPEIKLCSEAEEVYRHGYRRS